MEKEIELVWLPLARVAALYGKSVKTIRRMIEDGELISVKRNVESGRYRVTKSFVLADAELVRLDREHCLRHDQSPCHLGKELMTVGTIQKSCVFVTSYHKDIQLEGDDGQAR